MSKDVKNFVKSYIKKSYDYQNSQVIIDAKDQQAAEEGVPKQFLKYMSDHITEGKTIHKIPLQKGSLTIANKDSNLFTGFFSDDQGQIIEKFDAHTLEMIAKTLMVKRLVTDYDLYQEDEDLEDRPTVTPSNASVQMRIKFGDVEIELKKSIRKFVDDFRKARTLDEQILRKAIQSWRRQQKFSNFTSDQEAAEALLREWEMHKESFSQTVFAIKQMTRD
jgi:hypothetical protein